MTNNRRSKNCGLDFMIFIFYEPEEFSSFKTVCLFEVNLDMQSPK